MYFWTMEEVEEVTAGRSADHVAVSYAGHGVNSYAITYHLVYRGLAVFVQEAWGGIYMDKEAQAATVRGLFGRCHELVSEWEAQAPGRRLLCVDNLMRGPSSCGWLPDEGGPPARSQFLRDHRVAAGHALTTAMDLLGGPATKWPDMSGA